MDQKTLITHKLLQRTALTIPFEVFLQEVSSQYPEIGDIVSFEPIDEGYEAANFFLKSHSGEWVIKIFEKNRDPKNIQSMIKILVEGDKIQLPFTELISGKQGVLSQYQEDETTIFYYITKRFPGKSFESMPISREDMRNVCGFISKLHTLNFDVTETPDSWGIKNLIPEFEREKALNEVKLFVAPIIEELRLIPLEKFSSAIIHGDIQTKHVFKSNDGKYCLIDFGCMAKTAKVIDLSIFLAWFCFTPENFEEWNDITNEMLSIYEKTHNLTYEEKKSMAVLIRATYAAYFLKTSQLIDDGDHSQETLEWNSSARKLLDLAKKFNPVF